MPQNFNDVEEKLKEKLSPEDYELALKLLKLPSSQIRNFVEGLVKDMMSYEAK